LLVHRHCSFVELRTRHLVPYRLFLALIGSKELSQERAVMCKQARISTPPIAGRRRGGYAVDNAAPSMRNYSAFSAPLLLPPNGEPRRGRAMGTHVHRAGLALDPRWRRLPRRKTATLPEVLRPVQEVRAEVHKLHSLTPASASGSPDSLGRDCK
jgi:hypothetical protein